MSIGTISDGEAGSSVRTKLNAAITQLNDTGLTLFEVELDAADLLGLGTPLLLISPAGAGTIVQPYFVTYKYTFGSVAFNMSGPQLQYGVSGAYIFGDIPNILGATQNKVASTPYYIAPPANTVDAENLGIYLASSFIDPVGDGSLEIYMLYFVTG